MGIFSKIGSFFGSIGHAIGSAAGAGFSEVKDIISGTGKEISKQMDEAHKTINNVIQDGSNLANNLVNTGKGIIEHTEDKVSSMISMPLLLIAAGIGGLLLFRGDKVVEVAGNVATKAGPMMI